MARKVNVEVDAHFDTEGKMTPTALKWEDGRTFQIDRVLDVSQAASMKAGGQGMRYRCRILNKETYLWFENPNWFVEGK
ncbi:hypothetical protein V6615_16290 (plasmid) [Oscillospiraceae bacterium PP1C4]